MEWASAASTKRTGSTIGTLLHSDSYGTTGVLISLRDYPFCLQGGWFLQDVKFSIDEVAGLGQQRRDHCTLTGKSQGKAATTEQLWRRFFADPSRWWDNRFNKRRPRCPDFVHSMTKEALWIDDWFNPSWVEPELSALEQHPGSRVRAVYRQDFAMSKRLTPKSFKTQNSSLCLGTDENISIAQLTKLAEKSNLCVSFGVLRKLCGTGQLDEAIQAVDSMVQEGAHLSNNIFSCLLQACIDKEDSVSGRGVHVLIVKSGLQSKTFLASQLIQMYSVCGSLLEANHVFRKLPTPNVFAWSAIILANANLGKCNQAIKLYDEMKQSIVQPDGYVFAAVLKACASASALAEGNWIHLQVICSGFDPDVFVVNALVDMYAKCGSFKDACSLFDKLPKRDVVTWSAIISGYSQQGHAHEALEFFKQMQEEGFNADCVTFASALRACSNIAALDQGDQIHAHAVRSGQELDVFIGSSLINMYTNNGRVSDGYKVFEKVCKGGSVVVWNAMIAGYAACGHQQEAFDLFEQMQNKGIVPDKITFLSLLKEFSPSDFGKKLHAHVIKSGFASDSVVGSALLGMHSKCGRLDDARQVFDNLLEQDVVTWSAMIAGYVQHRFDQEALTLLCQMQQEGMEPNEITYVCILKGISSLGVLKQGNLIYQDLIKCGNELDVLIGNSLVNMYAKCGCLEDACIVLGKLPRQDLAAWNSIIAGYGHIGCHDLVLQSFYDMLCDGINPDGMTFIFVLCACSHIGLVDIGCQHFKQMVRDYGIMPVVDHYNCMVDLFGRAGELKWGKDLLQAMPYRHNVVGWRSLLSHCRTHKNVELGRKSFDCVVSMDCHNSGGFMLMLNIYTQACMWEDADEVEVLRKYANAWKRPGKAFIDVNSKAHDFIVGDKIHPQSENIYAKIDRLHVHLQEDGYTPDLNLTFLLNSDEKRYPLCGYC